MNEKQCRAVVRERSDGHCEKCGLRRGIQMHHRKNRSQLGDWSPANIMNLCVECHVHVTEHPAEAYENGWSVRSGGVPAEESVNYRGFRVMLDNLGNLWDVAA